MSNVSERAVIAHVTAVSPLERKKEEKYEEPPTPRMSNVTAAP